MHPLLTRLSFDVSLFFSTLCPHLVIVLRNVKREEKDGRNERNVETGIDFQKKEKDSPSTIFSSLFSLSFARTSLFLPSHLLSVHSLLHPLFSLLRGKKKKEEEK